MEDLSHLASGSLAPTSQHAGNQIWDNTAVTAPGGESGDLPANQVHPAPTLGMQPQRHPGQDGKPKPAETYTAAPAAWKTVSNG